LSEKGQNEKKGRDSLERSQEKRRGGEEKEKCAKRGTWKKKCAKKRWDRFTSLIRVNLSRRERKRGKETKTRGAQKEGHIAIIFRKMKQGEREKKNFSRRRIQIRLW